MLSLLPAPATHALESKINFLQNRNPGNKHLHYTTSSHLFTMCSVRNKGEWTGSNSLKAPEPVLSLYHSRSAFKPKLMWLFLQPSSFLCILHLHLCSSYPPLLFYHIYHDVFLFYSSDHISFLILYPQSSEIKFSRFF